MQHDPFRPVRFKKPLPALKHGGYAATILLPGEDATEFERLHGEIIDELRPNGALEEDSVATMAGLVWRKQNLGTIRIAERVRSRFVEIKADKFEARMNDHFKPELREKTMQAAEEEAKNELGEVYKLAEVDEATSFQELRQELNIQERLDNLIEKCLKRLLLLRGIKPFRLHPLPKIQD
jgi:hypothetical protein